MDYIFVHKKMDLGLSMTKKGIRFMKVNITIISDKVGVELQIMRDNLGRICLVAGVDTPLQIKFMKGISCKINFMVMGFISNHQTKSSIFSQ